MITSINYSFNEILKDKKLNEIRISKVPESEEEMDELAQCYANFFDGVKVAISSHTFFTHKFNVIVLVQDLPKDLQEVLGEERSLIWLKPNDLLMEAKSDKFVYICKVTEEEVEKLKLDNQQREQHDE
jgi:hypothetical protein